MRHNRKISMMLVTAVALLGINACALELGTASGGKTAERRDAPFYGYKLGVASYTFRQFSLDQAIAMTKELGLETICLKEVHLPLNATPEQCREAARKVKEGGLELASLGVIYMRNADEQEIRKVFEYAKNAGVPMITAAPIVEALPIVDKMVKEYDIKVAIHNHGPDNPLYPSPLDAYNAVQQFDKRIGICVDIGHSARNGDEEIEIVRKVADRVYDFHLKNVSGRDKAGKTVVMDKGVIDLPKLFRTLEEIGFRGPLHFEYEPEGNNPMPALQANVAYTKSLLAAQFGKKP